MPANPHQMESLPSFAVPAALQSTTTWTSKIAQPAQLTMVAMTAKWNTAATTVKLCHTSW